MVPHQMVPGHVGFFCFSVAPTAVTSRHLQEIAMLHQLLAVNGVYIGGGTLGLILVIVVVVLLLRR